MPMLTVKSNAHLIMKIFTLPNRMPFSGNRGWVKQLPHPVAANRQRAATAEPAEAQQTLRFGI